MNTNEDTRTITTSALGIGASIVSIFLQTFNVQLAFNSFISGHFTDVRISFGHAMGLLLLLGILKGMDVSKKENIPNAEVVKFLASVIILLLILLARALM